MSQTGEMSKGLVGTGRALATMGLLGVVALVVLAGPATPAQALPSQVTGGASPASTLAVPSTAAVPTIAPLGNQLPASPVTLPLRTRSSNGHVSPTFAYVSVAGFAVAIAIALGRMFSTRANGADRRPLPVDSDGWE